MTTCGAVFFSDPSFLAFDPTVNGNSDCQTRCFLLSRTGTGEQEVQRRECSQMDFQGRHLLGRVREEVTTRKEGERMMKAIEEENEQQGSFFDSSRLV